MKRISILTILICQLAFLASCEKESNETTYTGTVINTVTTKPFTNLEVKVTDGTHINSTVYTDANGQFSVKVNMNEINSSYYILVGDASCKQVRVDFKGFGQPTINLGNIEVEGPTVAVVTTNAVTNITTTSALCGGEVTSDGRSTVTERGVCWSKTEYPTIDDSHTNNGSGSGKFTSELTGLSKNTRYYVRAYATNSHGTNYGKSQSFTTSNGQPTVNTFDIGEDDIDATIITANGEVVDSGDSPVTSRGMVWSTAQNPTIDRSNVIKAGSGVGYYSCNIEGITFTTNTCYVRAFATNSIGTAYGEQVTISKETYDYANLPTMDFGGYHYKIYSMGSFDWPTAKSSCENLTFNGYSDWYLPDKLEVNAMNKAAWTSTEENQYNAYAYGYFVTQYRLTCYPISKTGNIEPVYAVRKYKQ